MPGVRTIKRRANLKTVDKNLLMKEEKEKVGLKLNNQKTKIMASNPITSWQIDGGNSGNSERLFWGAPWKKNYGQPRQHIKKQRHYFANKGPSGQSYDFFW